MPFYEYRCVEGHTFEVTQRMSDEPLTTCQVCGADASRVLFAPAIHFKGTGFHNTDYGSRRRGTGGEDASTSSTSDASTSNGAAAGTSGGSDGSSASSGTTVGLDKV